MNAEAREHLVRRRTGPAAKHTARYSRAVLEGIVAGIAQAGSLEVAAKRHLDYLQRMAKADPTLLAGTTGDRNDR